MAKGRSISTRVPGDVAGAASVVAISENRSVAEQISYWARIGMNVERSGSINTRRVLDAAEGRGQFAALDTDERDAAHAQVDARISEVANRARFGAAARTDGHATVSMDNDGTLVRINADGTRQPL